MFCYRLDGRDRLDHLLQHSNFHIRGTCRMSLKRLLFAALAFASVSTGLIPLTASSARAEIACESSSVLWSVSRKFHTYDRNVIKSGLRIEQLYDAHAVPSTNHIRETLIPRQYCKARAMMSDGRDRTVWYVIEYGQGFAGVSYRVDSCIPGLDPWHVYGADCFTVR